LSETVSHNNGFLPTSMGAVLRRCREYHGISLDEAVEATKMGRNYLLALENDRIEEFANQAYLKGFLRTYATYLGLNPDDMIRQFEKQQAQCKDLPAAAQQQGGAGGDAEIPKKRISLRKFALPAFFLLLIIITASIINRSETPPKRERPIPQAPQPQPVPATAPVTAIQPVLSSAHTPPPPQKTEKKPIPAAEQPNEAPSGDQNSVPAQPAEQPKSFIVLMKVSQNGTLAVTIDGGLSQTYDLTVGDAIEWKAEKNIALELSNAGGVEVEINGKALKSLGPAGKPVSIVLDANGVRQ
jgi:cytoskeletal protein RodZ